MISLGFSPCPNDTFIFYAIANKMIDTFGMDFMLHIEDVETLNTLAVKRSLDVTKVSCNAFRYLQNDYQFLRSGGALGRGCGPLVVAKDQKKFFAEGGVRDLKIAIPGRLTTAALLLELYCASAFNSRPGELISMPFHQIMNSVKEGAVDAGLIIHESRFTYQSYGLVKIIDLGEWWERETALPIPLGGIVAKKSLGVETITMIENLIRTSINYSLSHVREVMPYIHSHAREMDEEVMLKHIGLYVNEFTQDLGEEGQAALDELLKRSASCVSAEP
ncbi:MAG: 1,4-dihydroxy-6-naphthoate synthase [Nitrospirae bacterium]|nr:1,4-dihydroxy-6-naphthoate synthase [Nitrospirota bacterium]